MLLWESLAYHIKLLQSIPSCTSVVLFIHPHPRAGHPGGFQLSLTANNTVMNIFEHDPMGLCENVFGPYTQVELVDHICVLNVTKFY